MGPRRGAFPASLAVLTALVASLLVAGVASAEPTSDDKALALALFKQGRELMDAKMYTEACSKFAESQRLDAGGGTLLNLAVCHEAEGRTATAWAEYSDARGVARRDGRPDRVEMAQARMSALEPRLSRFVVDLRGDTSAVIVTRDRSEIPRVAWGTPIPVDPGEHAIEVLRGGLVVSIARLVVVAGGGGQTVSIAVPPELPAEAPPAAALTPADPSPASTSAPATPLRATSGPGTAVGWSLVGFGAASVAAGTYFGLRAFAKKSDSDDGCPGRGCTPAAVAANNAAATSADVATVSFAAGIVLIGAGTYLLLTARRTALTTTWQVSPALGIGSGSARFSATF